MSVWPIEPDHVVIYSKRFWTPNRTKFPDSERSQFTPIWRALISSLRESLPLELQNFKDSVFGHRSGTARPRWRHIWYDDLPNIHFEVYIDKTDASIGLHISDMDQIAEQIGRNIDDPTLFVPTDHHADTKVCERRVPIACTNTAEGEALGRILAGVILLLVPQVQATIAKCCRS